MRNLVLIHLESLNLMNYRMNKELFPTLQQLEKKSMSFQKYFSTATSTLRVIGDLLFGGLEQYEQCESLDFIPEEYPYQSSLFDELKGRGYETNIYIYPDGGDRESAERRHIAGFENEMVLITQYQEYLEALEAAMCEDKPFALMACNYISNLALNQHIQNSHCISGIYKWKRGYQYMDQCVQDIWDILERKHLLQNTTVIFYGDHGDEYWQHDLRGGLTHATEPYARLVWTPMWIYDNRLQAKETVRLTSTIDLKNIIEYLLDGSPEEIIIEKCRERHYALSRSAYAAQPVRETTFNKGYSLTDGKYFMLVSSRGLELYNIEMDPECQNNFLNFFILEDETLRYNLELDKNLNFHYRDFMDEKSIRELRQKFYFFQEKLKQEVTRLYAAAGRKEKMCEMNFGKICGKGYEI